MRLFHLIHRSDLEAAAPTGTIAPGPDGFVHLSADHQVAGTVARFYDEVPPGDLMVVEVDPDLTEGTLVWEEGEPGVLFPHLYGHIPLDSVVAVRVWTGSTVPDQP